MKLIDYTGKLNDHEKYIKIIDKLQKECKYVEVVILDERDSNELINKFKKDIILSKKVSKWFGTETSQVNNLYRIKATIELFKYLKKYETFCKYFSLEEVENNENFKEDYFEITDFGIDDIAFYDENDEYLLYTTTHEGFITISDKIIK